METKSKLLLSLDINQTIMVADPAQGVGTREGLNIAVAKAAFVRRQDGKPLRPYSEAKDNKDLIQDDILCWHDGSPCDLGQRSFLQIDGVPALVRRVLRVSRTIETPEAVNFIGVEPSGCISYYDLYGRDVCRKFTSDGPGKIYLPFVGDVLRLLTWPEDKPVVPGLVTEEEGIKYHLLVPSVFNMIVRLKLEQRAFTIILRTFGTDLNAVAQAIDNFAQDRHYLFTEPMRYISTGDILCCDRVHWKLVRGGEGADETLTLKSGRPEIQDIEGEEAIYEFLTSTNQTIGIQDDYDYWKANNWLPFSGKPMWFTVEDPRYHPIFLDDNIHYKEDDSIVNVRLRRTNNGRFTSVSGEVTLRMHDVLIHKTDIIQAILDPMYFLSTVRQCEENLASVRYREGFLDDIVDFPGSERSSSSVGGAGQERQELDEPPVI